MSYKAAPSPTGPAGGRLAGTYPNPTLASAAIVDADVASGAAIAASKVALVNDGGWTTPTQRSASMVNRQRRRTGVYFNPIAGYVAGSVALTAGLQYFLKIHVERPITIDAFALAWSTGATAGQIRIGLYADSGGGLPTGSPILDSGLVTASTTVTQQVVTLGSPFAVTTPDDYWIALLACSNLTGSGAVSACNPFLHDAASTSVGFNCLYAAGLTTTLGTPGTLVPFNLGTWPIVGYKLSAFT